VRSCQKLPLCPIEAMPASSEVDLLLAKAKPVSNGGSTPVITYLRRGNPSPFPCTIEIAVGEWSENM